MPISFRITGPQSIERLEPLIPQVVADAVSVDPSAAKVDRQKLDFVWETTCEIAWRARHSEATVLNKLHNVVILEDKANFAFLQLRMNCPVLDTYVASSPQTVLMWAQAKWAAAPVSKDESDWWVVKASAGNGGKDIWVMTCENYEKVVSDLPPGDTLVIQRYVARPMLWRGKKFHFRCYSALRADMSALLYHMAYILTAGYDYKASSSDDSSGRHDERMDSRRLITNLSVNKAIAGHPGQVPCNVLHEYPAVYANIAVLWKEVAAACSSFMVEQTSAHHFEFFGIDVIADEDGTCWLLEVNRLPGLEASVQNKEQEDVMYNKMMLSLLRIVMAPLTAPSSSSSSPNGNGALVDAGMWDTVYVPPSAAADASTAAATGGQEQQRSRFHSGAPTWKNTFGWRAFTRKKHNRSLVMLESSSAEDDKNSGSAAAAAAAAASSSSSSSAFSASAGKGKDRSSGPEDEAGISAPSPSSSSCGVLGCVAAASLRCSRCKSQHYCSAAHQKSDWSSHKRTCQSADAAWKAAKKVEKEWKEEEQQQAKSNNSNNISPPTTAGDGSRESRCFFCGEMIVMKDEFDGELHMRECPALQEQLASTDQFTIPKALRDKGVTLHDVEKKHEADQAAAADK